MAHNKNLVLLHLESVSNLFYKLHPEWFEEMNAQFADFQYYENYYSSGTSTLMTQVDLFTGDLKTFDSARKVSEVNHIKQKSSPLFKQLATEGYRVRHYYYGFESASVESVRNALFGTENGIIAKSLEDIYDDLNRWIDEDIERPFAVYICDMSSHIEWNEGYYAKRSVNEADWLLRRYGVIGTVVGNIFRIIKNRNCWDDTIAIAYGDHGDEYWYHGVHEGYAHAIEPYADIICTPLFIHAKNQQFLKSRKIISTTDLKKICLILLEIETDELQQREFAFSRNLFAAQVKNENALNKSYAVTDGEYLLIVAKQGLALYSLQLDPCSLNNILLFYDFNGKDIKYNRLYDYVKSTHLRNYFMGGRNEWVYSEFIKLKESLEDYVSHLCPPPMNLNFSDTWDFRDSMRRKLRFRKLRLNLGALPHKARIFVTGADRY